MKILLETNCLIEQYVEKESDNTWTYRINNENMFDNWMIVLDKYASIIAQMHYKEWLFINTIFSFLLKLKKEGQSLYYKQLHTRLVARVRNFMAVNNIDRILLHDHDDEIQEYLDIECFDYIIFDNREDLISHVIRYT